jgi:hypothetical protein
MAGSDSVMRTQQHEAATTLRKLRMARQNGKMERLQRWWMADRMVVVAVVVLMLSSAAPACARLALAACLGRAFLLRRDVIPSLVALSCHYDYVAWFRPSQRRRSRSAGHGLMVWRCGGLAVWIPPDAFGIT